MKPALFLTAMAAVCALGWALLAALAYVIAHLIGALL